MKHDLGENMDITKMYFLVSKLLYKYVWKTLLKIMEWRQELLLGKITQCGKFPIMLVISIDGFSNMPQFIVFAGLLMKCKKFLRKHLKENTANCKFILQLNI